VARTGGQNQGRLHETQELVRLRQATCIQPGDALETTPPVPNWDTGARILCHCERPNHYGSQIAAAQHPAPSLVHKLRARFGWAHLAQPRASARIPYEKPVPSHQIGAGRMFRFCSGPYQAPKPRRQRHTGKHALADHRPSPQGSCQVTALRSDRAAANASNF